MLNFSLSDEQLEIQKKSRDFAINNVLPNIWEYDDIDEVPIKILEGAFEAGLMNTDIPKKYGGKGYGILEGVLMTEELSAACPGVATSVFDNSLGLEPLILSDKEKIKEKYLREFTEKFKLMSFATSEPMMGSDVSGIRCKAEKKGNDYVLNGTKYWVTNGGIADYFTIFATIDPEKKHDGICAFVVDKNWEGVTVGRNIPKLGQRCSNTAGINFKNVHIPSENVLAHPGEGFVLAMRTFTRTRPVIGAFAVGAARSAMEYAIDYAKKRQTFGKKISNYQSIQFKIADMYQKVETARLLTWKAAYEADNSQDASVPASIAKLYSSEMALEVVNDALQIFGGFGYTKMFPIEKLLRDTRLFSIYEGTSEIQRMILSGYAMNSYEPIMPPLDEIGIFRGKSAEDKQMKSWRCRICGHVHKGDEAPEECPYCFFPKSSFKEVK